ncbi:family 10 glycosylhydrolase [Peribacillus simplex]|uniref:family 10 glycosylhydrolase n=1 Tax=Peribacillus simplex TaxID=1478 RepID=UPI0025A10854|nr:family 10 glycosylhydrolase [Peribacillus simplex]MDM5291755.1 family 10 glycosylhydrolase [Peribacillus simplex]
MNRVIFLGFIVLIVLLSGFENFTIFKVSKVKAATSSLSESWVSTPLDVEDSFVSSQSPSTNYSSSQYLVVGKHQTFATTRSFLKFKLPTLPKGAVITSAKLSLYQYYNSTNQVTVDIKPINSSWSATTLNWNNKPSVGSSVSNAIVDKPSWKDFFITNLVKSWYSGAAANQGVSVQFRDETQATKIFYSNNHSTYTTLKPKLTITYSIPEPQKEYRAFWVDMFHDGAKTPAQVDQLIKDVKASNANTIFLQVRRRGDAYYSNSLEPKTEDSFLQSGYDPLVDLIQKAHSANPKIQVHAWFAMMPIWNKTTPPKDQNHIFNVHGLKQSRENNWLSKTYTGSYTSGSDYVIDPGHPGAVDYTRDIIVNVAKNYDVDGIHMDLVRYMGEEWGYNDVSVQRYNQAYRKTGLPQPTDPIWKQWRRDQVSNMVRKIYTSVQSVKPSVSVSAATIAWGNGPKTMDDWNNSFTMNSALQDWRSWQEEGSIDLAIPMNYFREYDANQKGYFENWSEWEKNNQGKRMTLSGVGIYLNSIKDGLSQIKKAQAPSATGKKLSGVSLYSYAVTNKDNVMNNEFYKALSSVTSYSSEPAFSTYLSVPDLPWKIAPTKGHLSASTNHADHQLVKLSGPETRQTYTDGSGDFQIIDLTPGSYTFQINNYSYNIKIEAGKVSRTTLN